MQHARLRLPAIDPQRRIRRARSARLALARRRRLAIAGAAAAATAAVLHVLAPSPPPSRVVWVAARDLAAGAVLAAHDVRPVRWPERLVPDGASTARPVGTLGGGLRRGEPVTDARLLAAGALAGLPPGTVALPVRLADAATASLVRPGDRVDLLAGPSPDPLGGLSGPIGSSGAGELAAGVLVLAVPAGEPAASGLMGGPASSEPAGLLLVAVDPATAASVVAVAGVRPLSVAVQPPP